MKTTFKILLIAKILLLSSCITQEKCNQKYPCLKKDTTIIKYVAKDSIVTFENDYSWVEAYVICDSLNQVLTDSIEKVNGKRSNVSLKVVYRNGKQVIRADCKCDSLNIYLSWKEKYVIDEKNTIQVVKVPLWVHLKWILGLLIVFILSLIALKAVKRN